MDKKVLPKLLALPCCATILLCILVIYKCDTNSSRMSSFQGLSPLSFKNLRQSLNTPSGAAPIRHFTKTTKILNPPKMTIQNYTKNDSSNLQTKVSSKYESIAAASRLYDPSFGAQHHARDMPSRDVQELFHRRVPNMVYYVWCGEGRTFLYKHFVSVYSIWYQLEPDVIEIHYEFPPLEDKYNSWLSWLRSTIPSFSLQQLPPHVTGRKCGTTFGLGIIADRGGLFLDNGVILYDDIGSNLNNILTSNRSFSFFQDGRLAWAATRAGDSVIKSYLSLSDAQMWSQNMSSYFHFKIQGYENSSRLYNCSDNDALDTLKQNLKQANWISQPPENDKRIFCHAFQDNIHPVDILQCKNGSLGRKILSMLYDTYNAERSRKENSKICDDYNSRIPHIVHYLWFGSKNMTLSMYLSFLSTVYIAQPDFILIHTDFKLYGVYWDSVVKHRNVRLVYRESPRYIYDHRILYTQHRSDIVRADVLEKYGGIYLDWDALWLKSPKDLLQQSCDYDIILSRDHMPRHPFPDTINMGVVLAKPRSKFIRAWRAAWLHYKSDNFLFNAVELPYKIYELFPYSSLLHDRLQVMCYFLKCHPLFHPDHKHWGRSQPFNWTRDVFSIHFTHPDPPAFQNETALMSYQGMFADIARFIWQKRLSR